MDMKVTRGTTPIFNFVLPFKAEEINNIELTFMQNGQEIFTKTKTDMVLTDIETETDNGFIEDENQGDDFSSNDEQEEPEKISYCNCSIHLAQEDTLGFTFYAAAEKNLAYCQFRLVDNNGEAYASNTMNFRIYGVLKDGVI